MSAIPPQLLPLADGSLSCFDPTTGELYHNRVGAYTEALTHYVQPSQALHYLRQNPRLSLLDVCFGLGYNTFALWNEVVKSDIPRFSIHTLGIESDPNILSLIPQILNSPCFHTLNSKITPLEHNIYYQTQGGHLSITVEVEDRGDLFLEVLCHDARHIIPSLKGPNNSDTPWDLVFHDGFSPRKVPHLWTVDLFRHYHRLLEGSPLGRLLTYSVAPAVRGGLQEAGFTLRATPALGKKSGGTLAVLPPAEGRFPLDPTICTPLSNDAISRLTERAKVPYRDRGFSEDSASILARRELEQAGVS